MGDELKGTVGCGDVILLDGWTADKSTVACCNGLNVIYKNPAKPITKTVMLITKKSLTSVLILLIFWLV